jgi:rubrerythrin
MIAQKTKINNGVVTSDEATVQAAIKLLTRSRAVIVQRWVCEVCGMVHTGAPPTSCDSCGKEGSLVHQPDIRTELSSRC